MRGSHSRHLSMTSGRYLQYDVGIFEYNEANLLTLVALLALEVLPECGVVARGPWAE